MSNELTHLASLFNSKVKSEVSTLLDDFPWQSEVGKTLSATLKETGYDIDEEAIKSILAGKLVESEIDTLLTDIRKYRKVESADSIKAIAHSLFEYYQTQKVQQIFNGYSKDPNIARLLDQLRDVPSEIASDIKIKNLGLLDPDEVYQREIGGNDSILETSFQIIKDATPFQGYLPGQVVMCISPPGVGKSSFILQECAFNATNGKSVLMFILGDLMEFDMITRFISVVSGVPYYEIALNPNKYFTPEIKNIAANIDFVITPAKALTPQMIVDFTKQSKKRYDIVAVDYDSNVKTTSENMYDAGGELYDKLTEIARPVNESARLVFVACQPKIQFWDMEELPEESAGESSRKQHNVDIMITMGRGNLRDGKRGGIMSLPKVRRGKSGLTTPFVADDCGRLMQIEQSKYALLRVYRGK